MQLIDRRTEDGSRNFAGLPKTCTWQALCEHLSCLPGAEIASFVVASESGAWIGFTFQGYQFSVRHEAGRFCLSVRDPQCPDLTLYQVGMHCEDLLGSA